jgi:hypothetical protein
VSDRVYIYVYMHTNYIHAWREGGREKGREREKERRRESLTGSPPLRGQSRASAAASPAAAAGPVHTYLIYMSQNYAMKFK